MTRARLVALPPADTTTLKLESQVFFSFEAPPPYRINKGGYRIKLRLLPRVTPLPRSKVSKCASRCRVYIPSISRPFLSNYYRYIISFRSVFELGGERISRIPPNTLKKGFCFFLPTSSRQGRYTRGGCTHAILYSVVVGCVLYRVSRVHCPLFPRRGETKGRYIGEKREIANDTFAAKLKTTHRFTGRQAGRQVGGAAVARGTPTFFLVRFTRHVP